LFKKLQPLWYLFLINKY